MKYPQLMSAGPNFMLTCLGRQSTETQIHEPSHQCERPGSKSFSPGFGLPHIEVLMMHREWMSHFPVHRRFYLTLAYFLSLSLIHSPGSVTLHIKQAFKKMTKISIKHIAVWLQDFSSLLPVFRIDDRNLPVSDRSIEDGEERERERESTVTLSRPDMMVVISAHIWFKSHSWDMWKYLKVFEMVQSQYTFNTSCWFKLIKKNRCHMKVRWNGYSLDKKHCCYLFIHNVKGLILKSFTCKS